jgi:trigger factor
MNRLAMEYRAKASIPGFRKGKAPVDVVKKRYLDSIKLDTMENIINKAYEDALAQEKLPAIDQPKLSNIQFPDGDDHKPLTFRAEIEVLPEFTVEGYKDLKAEKKVKEFDEKEVEETIKQLQRQNAEYHPVERAAHGEDLVVVDLTKKYDKKGTVKDDRMEGVEVDLGADGVIKEFREGLRGMGIGEMKDIEIKYPEDYSDKEMAGNEVTYTALVKEVKEIKLPELNDEFAEEFTQIESMDKLKEQIRENIKLKNETDAQNELKSQLITKIVEKNRFDVPESMVDRYLKGVTEDFKKRYKDVDEMQLRQSYRQVAEDTIRWQFIFRRIADMEGMSVSEEDRAGWVKEFAAQYNMPEDKAREALGKAGKFREIDENIMERKVLEFIIENAEISQ